jgi:hypothetical protein
LVSLKERHLSYNRLMDDREIEEIISRIAKDFSQLMPRLSVEFLKPEAYSARISGRVFLPGEDPDTDFSVYPLQALPQGSTILVCTEEVGSLVRREAPRLRGALVEGLILNEIIFLALSRGTEPDPRTKAEIILRRHWPLQYATLFGRTLLPSQRPE